MKRPGTVVNNPISQTRRINPFSLGAFWCPSPRRPYMRPICALAAWLYGKGCQIPGFVPAGLHMDCILVSVGAKRPRLASAYLYRLLHR